MCSINTMIASIDIFKKYYDPNDECFFETGDFGFIYSDIDDEIIPEDSEDGKALINLGWYLHNGEYWAIIT